MLSVVCRALLLLIVLLAPNLPVQAAEKAPIKLGIIGLDNYQALDFTTQFHNPKAPVELQGIRVVAAYAGGSPDIEESVQSLPKWVDGMKKQNVEICDSIAQVVEKSDAILIMSLDGRTHLRDFKEVMKAGKPVYIGRPMATSLSDVLTMFDLAKEHKVPLFSCSQHRYVPGFSGMKNHPEVGQVLGCSVWGGCPEDPLHPGTIWKAVHGVETIYTIMGTGCVSVTRASTPETELVTGVWNDGKIGTYRGIRKGAVTYRAMVFGDKGISPSGDYGYDIPTKWVAPHGEYMGYKGLAIELVKFVSTGKSPVSPDETIEMFTFMEAAHQSKIRDGVSVKLADVLADTRKKMSTKK